MTPTPTLRPGHVRVGTRASALATTQTGHVAGALTAAAVSAGSPVAIDTVHVRTEGDRSRASLSQLGGTGVFVTALRDALLDGTCDVAVHSLKDLPTGDADGLTIAAMPARVSPLDALCARDGLTLATLPVGARVGTGSPRRKAQLLAARPDLVVVDIRGNVDTRLGRAVGPDADLDAVVLAAAGLERLGRAGAITELLEPSVMLPAAGQGVLAVECREADADAIPGLRSLDDLPSRLAATAERALLAALEAGCAAPVGALAHVRTVPGDPDTAGTFAGPSSSLVLDAVVCSLDGSTTVRRTGVVTLTADRDDAVAAAHELGRDLAATLLDAGAAALAPIGPARR